MGDLDLGTGQGAPGFGKNALAGDATAAGALFDEFIQRAVVGEQVPEAQGTGRDLFFEGAQSTPDLSRPATFG